MTESREIQATAAPERGGGDGLETREDPPSYSEAVASGPLPLLLLPPAYEAESEFVRSVSPPPPFSVAVELEPADSQSTVSETSSSARERFFQEWGLCAGALAAIVLLVLIVIVIAIALQGEEPVEAYAA